MSVIPVPSTDDIIFPSFLLKWLDENVGKILRSELWWMNSDTPAVGENWRVVKLYQRLGNGSVGFQFYIEFEHDVHLVQFKLAWNW